MNINTDNIQLVANQLVERYRAELAKSNIIDASSSSLNNAKMDIEFDGALLTVYITIPEHWKNVEFGRKAGKFPPPDTIRKWIEVKLRIPDPSKQHVYLVSRKIANEGIPPKKLLERTGLVTTRHIGGAECEIKATDEFAKMIETELVKALKQATLGVDVQV